MAELLPESPGWYLLSSGIAHSAAWVLHAAVTGPASEPELALTPDLLEVAAAAENRYPGQRSSSRRTRPMTGYDPEPRLRQSRQRRNILDVLMREQVAGQITNPAPLTPADS